MMHTDESMQTSLLSLYTPTCIISNINLDNVMVAPSFYNALYGINYILPDFIHKS